MEHQFDLIVLGAGSGGLAAAKRAAKYGARVAIVEGDRVGGTCVIRGCVPKKLLTYGSSYRNSLKDSEAYGIEINNVLFNSTILLSNVRAEVDRLNELHINLLENVGVKLYKGWGSFINSSSILISHNDSNEKDVIIQGNKILIAVGGYPTRPDIPGAELGLISDDIFMLKELPNEIIIVGAGFIACEFSCILNSLDVKVTQIVRGNRLLRGFDGELSNDLIQAMSDNGIKLIFGQNPIAVDDDKSRLSLITDSNEKFKCDSLLFATGRKPFVEKLAIENAGISITNDSINVDQHNMTNIPNIFAIGDVTNHINLTPVAIEEGRAFADSNFGDKTRKVDYSFIPSAVFSSPEIAGVGLTEEKAKDAYGSENLKIFKSRFRPMNRALPKTGSQSILKLIVEKDSDIIIGCHMLGDNAAEIIQMVSIALVVGATKADFDKTMALHPTVAEEFVTMS